MEIIAKISRGTLMDQIYIPKNRPGLSVGSPVIIKPLEYESPIKKPYFYNIQSIEPIKFELVSRILSLIDKNIDNENIIITGSFLEKGFNFNDIDVIIIAKNNTNNVKFLKNKLKEKIGVDFHIIILDNKSLIIGLQTDPLYQMMLSKCISKKRIFYKVKNKINYKILDLHLLKSKYLIYNFVDLNGNEKYYLVRNTIAIYLFLKNKRLTKENVDDEIKKKFNLKSVEEIKQNMLNKTDFLRKYNEIHKQIFKDILDGIRNDSKKK